MCPPTTAHVYFEARGMIFPCFLRKNIVMYGGSSVSCSEIVNGVNMEAMARQPLWNFYEQTAHLLKKQPSYGVLRRWQNWSRPRRQLYLRNIDNLGWNCVDNVQLWKDSRHFNVLVSLRMFSWCNIATQSSITASPDAAWHFFARGQVQYKFCNDSWAFSDLFTN